MNRRKRHRRRGIENSEVYETLARKTRVNRCLLQNLVSKKGLTLIHLEPSTREIIKIHNKYFYQPGLSIDVNCFLT